jgi:hypothetical protein
VGERNARSGILLVTIKAAVEFSRSPVEMDVTSVAAQTPSVPFLARSFPNNNSRDFSPKANLGKCGGGKLYGQGVLLAKAHGQFLVA